MKNLTKAFAIFLLISFTFAVNAQISIGPKVGINLASWGGDAEDFFGENQTHLGFQLGLAAEISINEMIAIQPELLFFQKGFKADNSEYYGGYGYSSKIEVDLNYLEIPILLKVKLGQEEGLKFFFTAGPSIGYGLNGKVKQETDYGSYTEKYEEDIDWDDDGINRVDLGLSLGTGVMLSVASGNLFFDVRYLLGLSNVIDDEDFMINNRGIGIALGYLVPIGE